VSYRQPIYNPNPELEEPVPLKPYDRWQWLGRASTGAAVLVLLAYIVLDFGGSGPRPLNPTWAWFFLFFGGLLLVRYRREPTEDEPRPETSERRRRLGGLFFVAIGLAAVVYNIFVSQGA